MRISQLAAASLRVEAAPQARAYAAMDLADSRREREALATYETILQGRPNPLIRSYCFAAIGTLRCREGQAEAALRAHQESSSACKSRINPAIDCIPLTILGGDRQATLDACKKVDDLVHPNHSAIVSFEKVFAARTYWGFAGLDAIEVDRWRALVDVVGPASWRIVHATIG